MAQSDSTRFRQQINNLGYNLIDGEGSQYLRTANWPNLSELYLGYKFIN